MPQSHGVQGLARKKNEPQLNPNISTQRQQSEQTIAPPQSKTQSPMPNQSNSQKLTASEIKEQMKPTEQLMSNNRTTLKKNLNTLENVVPIAPKLSQNTNADSCFDEDTHEEEDEIKRAMDLAQKLLNQKTGSSSKKPVKSAEKKETEEKKPQIAVKCADSALSPKIKDSTPKEGLSATTDLLMEETVYMDAVDEEISKWMEDFQKKKEKMKVKEMVARTKKLESKMKQKNELEKAFHSGKISLEDYINQIERLLY